MARPKLPQNLRPVAVRIAPARSKPYVSAKPPVATKPRAVVKVRAAVTPRAAVTRQKVRPAEEAEALIRDIATRRARIADDFYEIGVALNRLSARPLYTALGYTNFDDLLAQRRVIGRVQAFKLMAVTQAFDKRQALRLGVEKSYALVRYVAATPAHDLAHSLAATNARIAGKRLGGMSAKDLRDATKRLRSGAPADDHDLKDARATARKLQKKLRTEGAKTAKVRAHREGSGVQLRIDLDVKDAGVLLD
ncbi:MAG: hypothetical protein GXP55_01350 [Deltaproteobacteria bacterium]|nr:hypothetical protein [Deltaproteobacteria bacterium]